MRGTSGGSHLRPRLRASLAIVGLLSTLLVALAACDTGPTTPAVPQVLRFPLLAPPGGGGASPMARMLDPFTASSGAYAYEPSATGIDAGASAFIPSELIYPRLVEFDSTLAIRAGAASSWSISHDGKTYTFTLRQGIHWSDGTPIDANDFAYSLNRAASPCAGDAEYASFAPLKDAHAEATEPCSAGLPQGKILALVGDSIRVLGPRTLALTLTQPTSWFLSILAMPYASALPQSLVERYPTTWTQHLSDNGGLGGNLFKLTTNPLVFARNPAYWGTKPTLQQIDFTIYTDPQAAYQDFRAGKLDIGFPPASVTTGSLGQTSAHQTPIALTTFDLVNWTLAPFNDPTMRQAFDLALDKQQLAQTIWGGATLATNHIVPTGMPGYNPGLTGPLGAGVTGNLTTARTLEEAYVQSHCAGRVETCPSVTLWYTDAAPHSASAALAQAQVKQWQAAFPGYPIKAQLYFREDSGPIDTQGVYDRFQLLEWGWSAEYPDPQDWLQTFQPDAGALYPINDQAALMLIARAATEQNQATIMQDDQAAEQTLVNDVAEIPLTQAVTTWEASTHVMNFGEDALGLPAVIDQWLAVAIK